MSGKNLVKKFINQQIWKIENNNNVYICDYPNKHEPIYIYIYAYGFPQYKNDPVSQPASVRSGK